MFALFMLYFVFLHTVHPYASPHVQFMFHSSFVSGISLFCPFCILSVSWVTLFRLYYPAHIMYTVAGAGYEISFLARSRFNFREGRVFFRSEKNSKLEKVRLMWQRCRAPRGPFNSMEVVYKTSPSLFEIDLLIEDKAWKRKISWTRLQACQDPCLFRGQ